MKIKILLLALFFCFSGLNASKALLLTDFGTENFTVITEAGEWTQDANSVTVSELPVDEIFAGVFEPEPLDISGGANISLTGRVNGVNPDTMLTILLYNSEVDDFSDFRIYEVFTGSFAGESTTVALTLVDPGSGFTNVGAFSFSNSTLPDGSLSFTFESLQAIPEPSVYALSAVALGAAAWLRRRRKG